MIFWWLNAPLKPEICCDESRIIFKLVNLFTSRLKGSCSPTQLILYVSESEQSKVERILFSCIINFHHVSDVKLLHTWSYCGDVRFSRLRCEVPPQSSHQQSVFRLIFFNFFLSFPMKIKLQLEWFTLSRKLDFFFQSFLKKHKTKAYNIRK